MQVAAPDRPRRAWRRTMLASGLLLPALVVHGEPGTGAQSFRDWVLRCPQTAACSLQQRLLVQESEDVLMMLALQLAGDDRRLMAAIRVPLGVVLPDGLAMEVDGHAPQRVPFHHCREEGCFAIFPVPGELAQRFRAGITLSLTVRLLDGGVLRVPASLLGVTAGLRALDDADQAAR